MGHFEEGSDLTFDLSLEVEPEVELAKYKNGYKLTKPIYMPTDEDVEHALGHLQERFAEVKPQEAGAGDGDLIKGDLQYLDASGLPIVGSRVEDRYIKVGEGVFGGDVAKSLLDAKAGDEIRFDVPSPEKGAEDLHIQLTVKSVETHTLPELNDEFAKQVNPELENLDALKAEVLEDIQKQLDGEARRAYNQGIAQHMVDGAKVEIPEIMITNYLDRLMERFKQEQGPDVNEAEIRESNRDRAIWELKWYLTRKRVVRDEGLEATDADVDARIEELTADMPGDSTKIKALYKDKQYLPQIKEDILDQKVFTHLESFAKVKEKKVSSKEIGGYHGHAH
jgi:trigger factor